MKKCRILGKFLSRLFMMTAVFTSCQDDDFADSHQPLQVSVTANSPMVSRTIVTDEYLPDKSEIGVSLFDETGTGYDGQNYNNIKFTASGEGASQVWTGASSVSVSATPGTLVAYYPWQEVADLTAVPVETATQTDYMWGTPLTGVSMAAANADIVMNHALTAVRVRLILGDYTGDASVSSVSVSSPALGTAASLDVFGGEGALADITGQGDAVALDVDFDMVAGGTDTDVMLVPDESVTSGKTVVAATIGGKKFTVGIAFDEAYKQGYIYTYVIKLNNTGFEVTKVAVTPWQEATRQEEDLQFTYDDDEYVIKIAAIYDGSNSAQPTSLLSSRVQSRNGGTFTFVHHIAGFVGTIDWGDGTTDTYDEPVNFPMHDYPSDGNTYIIVAKGEIEALGVELEDEFEPFFQCLTEVVHKGRKAGIYYVQKPFYYCINLKSIPAELFDNCMEVTDFSSTFAECRSLESIPEGLFDNCKKVTSFDGAFNACSALQAIPEGLFDKCTEVVDFGGTFSNTGITSIPEGLFAKCTEVTDFERTFYNCRRFETIPAGLFDNCTKLMGFNQTFRNCYALQTIPAGLFDNCTEVESFNCTFYDCNALKNIPAGLFDKCTKVKNFSETFSGCESLTEIPTGLFDACTEVTSFVYTFAKCSNITAISEGMFEKNTKVTNFYGTFSGCGLTSIPTGLFDNNTEVTNFGYIYGEGCFEGCKALTSIPEGLFDNNLKVTDFSHVFSRSGITAISENLFDKCTEVTAFKGVFKGCTELVNIPTGIFDSNTKVTSFESAFEGCTALQTIPEGLFRYNTEVTDYSSVFYGCTALTEIPAYTFCSEKSSVKWRGSTYSLSWTGCDNLRTVKANAFVLPNVTNLDDLFYNAKALQTIESGAFNCPKVTSFSDAFHYCSGLRTVPEGLFDNCAEITNVEGLFYGCTALQEIPEGLFDKCTKVTSFYTTFMFCESLTSIPEGLFDKCTNVTSFYQTFYECEALTSIPAGLFDKCTEVKNFGQTFAYCKNLTGESPYTVIQVDGVDTKVHLYERNGATQGYATPTSYSSCFSGCKGLTDYENIPYYWK